MVSIGTVRNREYWRERFQELEEAMHRKGADIAQYIIKQYQLALRNMDRELAMWYQRFAENNGISFYGAKKMLTTNELSEFHMSVAEYIEVAQQENLSEEWKRKLENAYVKLRVSRLESLQIALQSSIEQLFKQQSDTLDTELPSIYDSSYYHVAFEIQKGFEIGTTFQGVDENKLKTVLSRPWTADSKTFSDRIWEHKNNLINALNLEMTQAVIRGDDYRGAAARIQNKMRVSQGAAMRLVMTESAFIASQAQHDCFKSLDVAQYEFIATLDSRTSEICRSMDRKHFKMSDFKPGTTAPPMHPNCRSCTAPYFGDEVDIGRAARGSDGKTFHVPGDMSYEEWKDKVLKDTLDDDDQEYRKVERGREIEDRFISGEILKLNRLANTVHRTFLSQKANLKPKELHFIEKTLSEAMDVVGDVPNSEKPKVYVLAPQEMTSGARYNAQKNIVYLRSDATTKEKIIRYQQKGACPDNYLSTYVHEMLHWKDAMMYINKHGKINNQEEYQEYLENLRNEHKKALEKIKNLSYNNISKYADEMARLGKYDEIYTEYRVAKLLGGRKK